MTNDEKDLIRAYLINQGLRFDSDVITCRQVYLHHRTESACMRLLRAQISKVIFDKICNDICALLNI